MNDEELAYGLRSIAAPIHSHSGEVLAALNLAVHRTMVVDGRADRALRPRRHADGARHLAQHGAQAGARADGAAAATTAAFCGRRRRTFGRRPRSGATSPGSSASAGSRSPATTSCSAGRSTTSPAFWSSIWEFFEVKAHAPYSAVLASDAMPGATLVPGRAAQLRRAPDRRRRRTRSRSRSSRTPRRATRSS